MRINKFLASCTQFSRRKSEELVLAGKVKVNGSVISSLSVSIDENNDVVTLDGKVLSVCENFVYLMMHKPKGYLCTRSDVAGRKTIYDLIPEYKKIRLFSVGRLDRDTEGLILLTNDGDITNKLIHPKHEVEKTYVAKIEGNITETELEKLRDGVVLDDGFKTSRAKVNLLEKNKEFCRVEVTIHEGKNRQVRRMFEAIKKHVTFLKRTKFGPLSLGGLTRGTTRLLKQKEIESLKKII